MFRQCPNVGHTMTTARSRDDHSLGKSTNSPGGRLSATRTKLMQHGDIDNNYM